MSRTNLHWSWSGRIFAAISAVDGGVAGPPAGAGPDIEAAVSLLLRAQQRIVKEAIQEDCEGVCVVCGERECGLHPNRAAVAAAPP